MLIQPCANEDFFFIPKARNSPIKQSFSKVQGLPDKLKIFRIAGSKYWQVRLFNHGKYIAQSLKTTEKQEAELFAQHFYSSLKHRGVVAESDREQTPHSRAAQFDNQNLLHDLMQEVLAMESERLSRDEITHGSYLMTKGRLEGLVFQFLKAQPLAQINTETMEKFVSFLTAQNLAPPTIVGYLALMRKLLKLLLRKQVIAQLPLFPKVKSPPNSRGAFTVTEYRAILKKSKALVGQTFTDWGEGKRAWIRKKYQSMSHDMNALIRFMVYTFLRPGDIRQLKHKHVEVVRGAFNYLRLTLPEVKRHKAPVVSLPAAVGIYERLLQQQLRKGYGQPEDYVFFPEEKNRRLILDVIGWQFNWILNALGIKQGPHGVSRSLYSLRHTSITFRLIYGGNIDLLTLARNARTSVEMIEKFYASTLSAEMNIALLHGKRH